MTSIYNGQFSGNILVVGRTNCGKTTFIEKLGLNDFFGEIIKTEWISGKTIDKKREGEIQSYFKNETEVHVAEDEDQLNALIETFKRRSEENDDKQDDRNDNVNSLFGENKKLDRLIIMDDVSGIADTSKYFANFLTVSRKYRYNCVYVFHVINSSQIWQKILSQTNIFNIFPATVPFNSVSKIIQSNCILQGKKYVPVRSLWLSRVFTDLANSNERHCLTLDCGYQNKNGPGRFRSSADNPVKQVCYFNKSGDDVYYNTFISERIKEGELANKIYFKIEKVKGYNDKENFDAKNLLEDDTRNIEPYRLFDFSKSDQNGRGLQSGNKRFSDSFTNFYSRERKSAKPKFIS